MARGVNKVILIGNIGQDPEVRFMPSGNPVCNLRLATTDSWNDRQTGQRQERTEWHSIVLFNKLAEIAQQYVKKGSRLYIEGRLQTRQWQGQDGQNRYSTEIVANDMQMLDSRGGDGGNSGGQQGGYQQQNGGNNYGGNQGNNYGGNQGNNYGGGQPNRGNQGAPANQAPQQNSGYGAPQQNNQGSGAPNPSSFDDFDDEIPF